MLENIVTQFPIKETSRTKIAVVFTPNWKDGQPIDPKIPKYLVWVRDKWSEDDGYCPADSELPVYCHSLPLHDLKNLIDAFTFKETHNLKNLRNPEPRHIENYIQRIFNERIARGERY